MKRLVLCMAVAFAIILTGCSKDDAEEKINEGKNNIDEMNAINEQLFTNYSIDVIAGTKTGSYFTISDKNLEDILGKLNRFIELGENVKSIHGREDVEVLDIVKITTAVDNARYFLRRIELELNTRKKMGLKVSETLLEPTPKEPSPSSIRLRLENFEKKHLKITEDGVSLVNGGLELDKLILVQMTSQERTKMAQLLRSFVEDANTLLLDEPQLLNLGADMPEYVKEVRSNALQLLKYLEDEFGIQTSDLLLERIDRLQKTDAA